MLICKKCFADISAYKDFEKHVCSATETPKLNSKAESFPMLPIICEQCGIKFFTDSEYENHGCSPYYPPKDEKESICDEAERIINGPRRDSYGPIGDSAEWAANMINAVLGRKLKERVTAQDYTLIMSGLKIIREANSHQRDNLVDIVGYVKLNAKLNGED